MNDISFFLYNMQKYYFHFYALSWLSFGNSPVAQDNVMANGKDSSAEQAKPLARRAALGGVGAAVLAGPSPGRAQSRPTGGGMSGQLRLQQVARVELGTYVTSLAWSPDGGRIAAAHDWGSKVAVIDTSSWRVRATIQRSSAISKATLGFAAGGRELVTRPGEIRTLHNNPFVFGVFETDTGRPLRHARWPADFPTSRVPEGLAVSPDGKLVVLSDENRQGGYLHVYDVATTEFLQAIVPPRRVTFKLASINHGNHLAVDANYWLAENHPSVRKAIEFFDLPGLRRERVIPAHIPSFASLAWSPNGDRLPSGAQGLDSAPDPTTGEFRLWRDEDPIRVWDAGSGRMILSFAGQFEPIETLAWHPSGDLLLAESAKGTGERGSLVQVFPAGGGSPVLRYFAPGDELVRVPCFCPRTGLLAWGEQGAVRVFRLMPA